MDGNRSCGNHKTGNMSGSRFYEYYNGNYMGALHIIDLKKKEKEFLQSQSQPVILSIWCRMGQPIESLPCIKEFFIMKDFEHISDNDKIKYMSIQKEYHNKVKNYLK